MLNGYEHHHMAANADFFEEWGAATYRSRSRQPTKRLRLRATSINLARCMRCGDLAEWDYGPMGTPMEFCDHCVPRGCDCNIIDRDRHIRGRLVSEIGKGGVELFWIVYDGQVPEEERDSLGRLLPCIEFDYYPGGFPRK